MSLLWLQVSACEQRVCIHRLTLWVCCGFRHQPANNGVVFTGCTLWVCCGFWYPMRTTGLYSPAAHHESVVALVSLWRSWGETCYALGVEWGWRYPTVNNGRVFTGCTLWVCCGFWYPIWTMGLYSPAAHHEVCGGFGIRLWSKLRVVAMAIGSWMRLEVSDVNNGVVLPAAHHESAVALVSDCEQWGCIHQLHIMSLLWLLVSDWTTGCFHRLEIMSFVALVSHGTTGLFSPAAHHESVVASGIRLQRSWGG